VKLYDGQNDRVLDDVTVYLERHEAEQLRSYLQQLLDDPSIHHLHLSSTDYQRELTVTIYYRENADQMATFDERSRRLILEDE
jgi:hypothetical protein